MLKAPTQPPPSPTGQPPAKPLTQSGIDMAFLLNGVTAQLATTALSK